MTDKYTFASKTTTFEDENFTVVADYVDFGPDAVWDRKEKMHEEFDEAARTTEYLKTYISPELKEKLEAMGADPEDEEMIKAACERLRGALAVLYDRVEEVVPHAIASVEDGQAVDFHIHCIFAQLDQDAIERRERAYLEQKRTSEKLAALSA